MSIFKLDTDGIKMIWHFGIIDVPCIELYGIIGHMKEKEEELQLKVTNQFNFKI